MCIPCQGPDGDDEMLRVEVWSNRFWRLTTSISGDPSTGFSYLEPRRHIADITALNGLEATSFGPVLAHCTRILKDVTGTELVYVYIFGGSVAHLHVHLAPHSPGDGWNDELIRGPLHTTTLPSGVELQVSSRYPPLPEKYLRGAAAEVRARLAADPPPMPG